LSIIFVEKIKYIRGCALITFVHNKGVGGVSKPIFI